MDRWQRTRHWTVPIRVTVNVSPSSPVLAACGAAGTTELLDGAGFGDARFEQVLRMSRGPVVGEESGEARVIIVLQGGQTTQHVGQVGLHVQPMPASALHDRVQRGRRLPARQASEK